MAMNVAILQGRLTRDPEKRYTANNTAVASFSLAVDRRFKDKDGEKVTDFINCVAWRQTADYVGNYVHKGDLVTVRGSIQTRDYEDKNGNARKVTEIVVEEVSADGSRRRTETNNEEGSAPQTYGRNYSNQAEKKEVDFVELGEEDALPF